MNTPTAQRHIPNSQDIQVAQTLLEQLETIQSKNPDLQLSLGKKTLPLPTGIARLLTEILLQTANGRIVTLQTLESELSSQEAADYLGVSRQYLVNEADARHIPHRKIGSHRRFHLQDILDYQVLMERASLEARQELADEGQRLGLDD